MTTLLQIFQRVSVKEIWKWLSVWWSYDRKSWS